MLLVLLPASSELAIRISLVPFRSHPIHIIIKIMLPSNKQVLLVGSGMMAETVVKKLASNPTVTTDLPAEHHRHRQ